MPSRAILQSLRKLIRNFEKMGTDKEAMDALREVEKVAVKAYELKKTPISKETKSATSTGAKAASKPKVRKPKSESAKPRRKAAKPPVKKKAATRTSKI